MRTNRGAVTNSIGKLFLEPFFDGVHQHSGDRDREFRFNFTNAGRAGNVHFGQTIANDIRANKDQAFGFQRWADAAGNFPVAFG